MQLDPILNPAARSQGSTAQISANMLDLSQSIAGKQLRSNRFFSFDLSCLLQRTCDKLP
jgi:hypothetical protein